MAFLPQGNLTLQVTDKPKPSKTYKVDWENGRIVGYTDGQDAVRQAILKALITERYRYLIYDNQYGSELGYIVKQDYSEELIESIVESEIRETLSVDDRIVDLDNFEIEFLPQSKIHVTFDANTIFGTIQISYPDLQV